MRLLAALYERMGLNAYALGDYDKAERWMARLSRSEGESMRVLRNLGVVRMARGDFAGARRYLEREERLYGETPERHRVLGDLAYAAGVRDEAVKRYASARKTAGDDRSLLDERLAICRNEDRFGASRESARVFSEAESLRASGRTAEALAYFLKAGDLDPTNWPAFNNAGVILLAQEDGAERARDCFVRAATCVRLPAVQENLRMAEAAVANTRSRSAKGRFRSADARKG